MSAIPIQFENNVSITGTLTITASSGYIDLNNQEAKKLVVYNTTGTSYTTAVGGSLLYDSSRAADKRLGYYDGSTWQYPSNDRASHTGTQTASTISDFATTVRGTVLTGLTAGSNTSITATDNVLSAFANVQAQINAKQAQDADLDAIAGLSGTAGYLKKTASNTWALDNSTFITGNQTITLSGDASGSGTTAITLTLANSGVTAGTYTKVTVDAKGRVTAGASLQASDIPTHATNHKTGGSDAIKLNELATPTANIDLNGYKITNSATPVNDTDLANKAYVDNLAAGAKWKTSVRAATITAGTLATSFMNGSTIDGILLATNDRILIKNQVAASENGIYTVNSSGAPTRTSDADTWSELISASVWIEQGTTQADTGWNCTVDAGGTLNTTAITWTQFTGAGQIIAGAGLTKTGNTIDVVAADSSIVVNADSIGLGAGYKNKTARGTFTGTGSASSFTLNHAFALTNQTDVEVSVYKNNVRIYPAITCTDANNATVDFAIAPANGVVFTWFAIGKQS